MKKIIASIIVMLLIASSGIVFGISERQMKQTPSTTTLPDEISVEIRPGQGVLSLGFEVVFKNTGSSDFEETIDWELNVDKMSGMVLMDPSKTGSIDSIPAAASRPSRLHFRANPGSRFH